MKGQVDLLAAQYAQVGSKQGYERHGNLIGEDHVGILKLTLLCQKCSGLRERSTAVWARR